MTHRFVLMLAGVSEINSELADTLYEAAGGDVEFNVRDGVAFLEVVCEARVLREAILATIKQVEAAVPGLRVVWVESEAANTIAKINADLLGVGDQT